MYMDSRYLHAFMLPGAVVQPVMTTKRGCNSATKSQARLELCLRELCPNLLAKVKNFGILHTSERDLMCPLDTFSALQRDITLLSRYWNPSSLHGKLRNSDV